MRGRSLVLLPHSFGAQLGRLEARARCGRTAIWARSRSSLSLVLNAPNSATEYSYRSLPRPNRKSDRVRLKPTSSFN
jgi:hypothetical protein